MSLPSSKWSETLVFPLRERRRVSSQTFRKLSTRLCRRHNKLQKARLETREDEKSSLVGSFLLSTKPFFFQYI